MAADALILTAELDGGTFARLDQQRRAHFPAALNRLSAHLTLFHHLPGEALDEAMSACAAAWPGAPIPLRFPKPRSLGRGVAWQVDAPELHRVRRGVAERFAGRLTPQDSQGFRPHVTVQNKVEPAQARELLARLSAEPAFAGACVGLSLWWYRGGPWERAALVPAG